jgi:hypothetical protein
MALLPLLPALPMVVVVVVVVLLPALLPVEGRGRTSSMLR